VTRFFCCWLDPSGASCHTSFMDGLLQDHNEQLQKFIMRSFGVKQRTLQRWMKAGVVPNVYRTKGGRGHYRIRMPKGMRVDLLPNWELVRSAAELTTKDEFPAFSYFAVGAQVGVPDSFVRWYCQLRVNIKNYTSLMRPIWHHERTTGAKVAFYTLNEMRALAKKGSAILRETTSRRDVADFLSSFEPMGENPLERVQ